MAGYAKYQVIDIPSSIVKIGDSEYPRPFIIVEIADASMYVMPLSTQIQTFYTAGRDFLIERAEDGFATTGLGADSFVRGEEFRISTRVQLRVRGHLSGDLLERFEIFMKRYERQ